jgi:hypothetical protein
LLPFDTVAGRCAACGAALTGRRTRWCGKDCERIYHDNHYWGFARRAALKRDGHRCVKCGWLDDWHFSHMPNGQMMIWSRSSLLLRGQDVWLEVNHVQPRLGAGYGTGCWNHISGLETLCHPCHVKVTQRQRIARARALAS